MFCDLCLEQARDGTTFPLYLAAESWGGFLESCGVVKEIDGQGVITLEFCSCCAIDTPAREVDREHLFQLLRQRLGLPRQERVVH